MAAAARRSGLPPLDLNATATRIAALESEFDLVLVDTPYEDWARLEPKLARYLPPVLAENGLLVVETAVAEEPDLSLEQRTSRRYGAARITLFER